MRRQQGWPLPITSQIPGLRPITKGRNRDKALIFFKRIGFPFLVEIRPGR